MGEIADITGSWVHSHEEDHDGIRVYRPAAHELPPSRGRSALTLHPDGTAVTGLPGPDDRGTAADCTWEFTGGTLIVRTARHTTTYAVTHLAEDHLDLRPV